MKRLLMVVALMLFAATSFAAVKKKAPLLSFSPQFAVGMGAYAPTDFGYIRSWKGIDAKNYAWGTVGVVPWSGLAAVLKVEQQIQRLPNGARPTMLTRLEVGWKF